MTSGLESLGRGRPAAAPFVIVTTGNIYFLINRREFPLDAKLPIPLNNLLKEIPMANNFFVAYDLDAPGQDYRKIENAINQCGDAVKIQLSLYYLKSKHTQAEIIAHCWKAMDKNDRLLVIDAANATWENGLPGAKEFIQQRWNT